MDRVAHWQQVYATRQSHQVAWYQVYPELSLAWIGKLITGRDEPLIDVGGGASTLVDHLLDDGYTNLSVLDISANALAAVQARLGERAKTVSWLVGDVTKLRPAGPYRIWHDRAVFHFLTDPAERLAYADTLRQAVPVGGHTIIATFADDGPERCSNLPVCRYTPQTLQAALGKGLALVEAQRETHTTPAQGKQNFIYCCFARVG